MVTNHSVTLAGLNANMTYYLRVGSADTAGNGPTISSELSFTTDPNPDTTAPQITAPPTVTSKTNATAVIEWQTDENSNGLVQYGTQSGAWGNYPSTASNLSMVLNHKVNLTGLQGSTTYYFRVGSSDVSGNGPATSSEVVFRTDPDPDFAFQNLPLNLFNGSTPKSGDVILTLNSIPAAATTIELTMTVFDPDFQNEGRLYINGQGPVPLFGAEGNPANDALSVTLAPINTDRAWYQLGQNTLTFWHDSTQGYQIENIALNFISP